MYGFFLAEASQSIVQYSLVSSKVLSEEEGSVVTPLSPENFISSSAFCEARCLTCADEPCCPSSRTCCLHKDVSDTHGPANVKQASVPMFMAFGMSTRCRGLRDRLDANIDSWLVWCRCDLSSSVLSSTPCRAELALGDLDILRALTQILNLRQSGPSNPMPHMKARLSELHLPARAQRHQLHLTAQATRSQGFRRSDKVAAHVLSAI